MEDVSAAIAKIDQAQSKKLIKKNTAARRKASLAKIAKDAGVTLSTGKKAVKAPTATPAKKAVAAKSAAKPAVKKASVTTKPAVKKAPAAKKPAAKKPAAK
jgi:hypothetical protein